MKLKLEMRDEEGKKEEEEAESRVGCCLYGRSTHIRLELFPNQEKAKEGMTLGGRSAEEIQNSRNVKMAYGKRDGKGENVEMNEINKINKIRMRMRMKIRRIIRIIHKNNQKMKINQTQPGCLLRELIT